MGRCECATASIGYRVSIRDLIESICDDESCTYAYDTLTDYRTFVEDQNEDANRDFRNITEYLAKQGSWETTKEEWRRKFDKLIHEDLLLPVIQLADTERWGYNREGIHGMGSFVTDDFTERLEELQQRCPPHHRVTWMVRQSGG